MPETIEPALRADARQNRERILEAAGQLLVEQGADVPLDQIAERASVSIATLYRRFTDRGDLLRALVLDESEAMHANLQDAVERVESGCSRVDWEELMHEMVVSASSRLSPIMVAVGSGLIEIDDEMIRSRSRGDELFGSLVESAQARGLVRLDTDAGEVQALLISAILPVPHLSVTQNRALASRRLYFLLAGLHPIAALPTPVPGEPFHFDPAAFGSEG